MTASSEGVWARLAEPVAPDAIKWRQDGKPRQRDGRWIARFVCYVEAGAVRERLDAVVPGEWDLTLQLVDGAGTDHNDEPVVAVVARLSVAGVVREDVGQGRDYKAASTDAFKRAAVRFGIAHELYSYGQNWVEVDGDGRYAKPVEDPAAAYARRMARQSAPRSAPAREPDEGPKPVVRASVGSDYGQPESAPDEAADPKCPECGGRMWDNRADKRNPKAPDFKCRDRNCEGVIWPPKKPAARGVRKAARKAAQVSDFPEALHDEPDELPF